MTAADTLWMCTYVSDYAVHDMGLRTGVPTADDDAVDAVPLLCSGGWLDLTLKTTVECPRQTHTNEGDSVRIGNGKTKPVFPSTS